MDSRIINYNLGRLLLVLSVLLIFPLGVSIIYKEGIYNILNFVIPIGISTILGFILLKTGSDNGHIYVKEAMFITSVCWVLFSLIGAIPLYRVYGNYETFIDAFFEMVSGFTTCGATVATDIETLPNSIAFWRSFSHFIGGMGILVFTLAIMPNANKESSTLMEAEVPGPVFGKITPKFTDTARWLYTIYFGLTVVTAIFLLFGGMDLFDSIIYAFGTAGTGGFGNKGASIGFYNSRYIEMVLAISMALFGINFNLYYHGLVRKNFEVFKDEEFKFYLGVIFVVTLSIFFNIYRLYDKSISAFIDSFFAVSSTITTTGYVSVDYDKWPLFSRNLLILIMFIGGCAGSTAGGIKVSRIIVIIKSSINQVVQAFYPKRITINRINHKKVDEDVEISILKYFGIYVILFISFLILTTLGVENFEAAFSAVAATFNNVGPGMQSLGPIESFIELNQFTKFVLTIAMLVGRLEIFPMLLLFSPNTYKKSR